MTTHIALLRGINVGGNKTVAMADLRDLLAELGFDDVRSLLQSGNLVFRADDRPNAGLERLLEAETEKRLALRTAFFARTAEEWRAIVAANPFPEEAKSDPGHLVVTVLKDAPDAAAVDALRAAITGPETVRAEGPHLYAVYPEGIGRSRLTLDVIERKLGTRGTARNWNTLVKLGALAGGVTGRATQTPPARRSRTTGAPPGRRRSRP
ncbi:MAG: DUF1697 domain-containing protein [Dehalococcoidia bacterium]